MTNWGRGNYKRLKEFPQGVLDLVRRRQGHWTCVFCRELGIQTPDDVPIEVDHKLPLSRGGDNNHLNLQTLCRSHNRGRGNRGLNGFRRPAWERRRDSNA